MERQKFASSIAWAGASTCSKKALRGIVPDFVLDRPKERLRNSTAENDFAISTCRDVRIDQMGCHLRT